MEERARIIPSAQAAGRGDPGGAGRGEDQQGGEGYLGAAAAQHQSLEAQQAGEGEFETDGEQQQDHAEFGHYLDLVDAADQVQAVGADQQAGDQVADDRRLAQAGEEPGAGQGEAEQDQQVLEDREIGHGGSSAAGGE